MFAASVKEVNVSVPASKNAARKHPQLCLPAIRSASRTPNAKKIKNYTKQNDNPAIRLIIACIEEAAGSECYFGMSCAPQEPTHCHQSQPSAVSATPATQNADRCRQVPRPPRKVHVHIAKCQACNAHSRGDNGVNWEPSAPPEPAQGRKWHACHAKCASMSPCLPLKVKVNVAKCHACHPNSRSDNGNNWEPSAPPEPAQCHKRHACHAN